MNESLRERRMEQALEGSVPEETALVEYPANEQGVVLALRAIARHRGYPPQVHQLFVDEMLELTRESVEQAHAADEKSTSP